MRESRTPGSVRGAVSNRRPYRDSETPRDRATSFDAGGAVTGWQAWLTAYTPTGKVAVTTDPLGNETRTLYDTLDRPTQVTDASGRVSGKTYDLAGQELTEVRGIGTPLQQNYATYSWWPDGQKRAVIDANANRIGLAYDGFNRLSAITHPDNTTELSQYDPDGDLTIWTNRGGFSVVRCYDVLNRKVSEEGRTGATNSGGLPDGRDPQPDRPPLGHPAQDLDL